MKTRLIPILLLLNWFFAGTAGAQVFPNLGGQRTGISAMTFLKNELSPRSIALGGASVGLPGDAFAANVNPAQGASNLYPSVALSTRNFPAGIFQSYLGALIPTSNKDVWTVSLNYLSSGNQLRRTEFQPFGDGSVYSSDAWKAGIGYSKALSKMFSFGANINFIREQLAQYAANAASVDLGFLYQTDWRNLSFAVGLQHFGVNSTLSGTDLPIMYNRPQGVPLESYGAPTLFSMGVSMVPYKQDKHEILTTAQLNHPNDNAENIRLGVQYGFDSLLFVRVGYRINVPNEHISAGVGLRSRLGAFPLVFEYAVLPHRSWGLLHTLGIQVSFVKPGH